MARAEPPDPGLPIKLEPCGNGEFAPSPATPLVREAVRRANAAVEQNARRLGMSRRQFLRSSMGAATVLSVFGACSRESGQTGGEFVLDPTPTAARPTPTATDALDPEATARPTSEPSPAPTSGATAAASPEPEATATLEPDAAEQAIGPLDREFIFDVQNHLLEFEGVGGSAPGFPQSACGEADPRDCYSIEHFLELLFLESDTHMVMLSAIPFAPGALSPEVMERTMEAAEQVGCSDRVLMQGESFPTAVGIDAMAEVAEQFPISAFKTYTNAPGPAWRLDDDTGDAYFEQVKAVEVPIVSVHKGLSGNNPASSPADVGPAAVNHPEVSILVYHSGFENVLPEGPYDPATGESGVDRLITSLAASGIGPGDNVYAELGSTWRTLMTRPDEAAHLLGKLLVAVGEDNILWGTDSIWYGSPQDQIEAFRSFRISDDFQERFGYPPLTAEVKRKILGHNAARLFGVDPVYEPCRFSRDDLLAVRAELTSTHHTHAASAAEVFAATQP